MSMKINNALQMFNNALGFGVKDDDRMTLQDGAVAKGAADAGLLGRSKPVSAHGDDTQTRQNNAIRTELMNALVSQYGTKAKIPASVLQALKGSSLVGGTDMKTDGDGNVISGRPLTARRIRTVIRAVTEDLAKSAPADNTAYWEGDLSAQGTVPNRAKILGRLAKMASLVPGGRFPHASIPHHVADSFATAIKIAQKNNLYGDAMVTFITDKIRERNSVTLHHPDTDWFQGVLDNNTDRLKRDVSRFLNVGGRYDDYWQDPEAAMKRDAEELNMQSADAMTPDNE